MRVDAGQFEFALENVRGRVGLQGVDDAVVGLDGVGQGLSIQGQHKYFLEEVLVGLSVYSAELHYNV